MQENANRDNNRAILLPWRYQYTALQDGEIRLLELAPRWQSEDLCCRLITVSLDDYYVSSDDIFYHKTQNRYTALSYVWGTADHNYVLNFSESYLMITSTLGVALEHTSPYERLLWVDQVCINQADPMERGRQVQLMDKIYRSASAVRIWLGTSTTFTRNAIRLINETNWTIDLEVRREDPSDWVRRRVESTKIICELLSNQWFFRAWTFQEFVVAKESYFACGNDQFKLSQLDRFLIFLSMHSKEVNKTLGSDVQAMIAIENTLSLVDQAKRFHKSRDDYLEFAELLLSRREAIAKDPLDRIYCLLGLCDQSVRDVIIPDYTATLQDLQILVARVMIADYGAQALSLVEIPHIDKSLPSWVTTWAQSQGEEKHDWVHFWRSHGELRGLLDGTARHSKELRLQGVWIGLVTDVRKVPGMKRHRFNNYLGDDIPVGDFSVIAKIMANRKIPFEWKGNSSWPAKEEESEKLSLEWAYGIRLRDPAAASETPVFSSRFDCLAVSTVENGDFAYLFQGCYTPFVLRRKDGNWTFVGPCYMHGFYHHELARQTGEREYVDALPQMLGPLQWEETILE